jgi:hypothetical protein
MSETIGILAKIGGFLGGLSATVLAYIGIRNYYRAKKKEKLRIFFSIQYNELNKDKYDEIYKSVFEAYEFIKIMKKVDSVYWYNYEKKIDPHKYIGAPDINISEYMKELRYCNCFIAVISDKIHSSIFFESGFALAKEKDCYFFVENKESTKENPVPSIMDGSTEIFRNAHKIFYPNNIILIKKLRELLSNL